MLDIDVSTDTSYPKCLCLNVSASEVPVMFRGRFLLACEFFVGYYILFRIQDMLIYSTLSSMSVMSISSCLYYYCQAELHVVLQATLEISLPNTAYRICNTNPDKSEK